MSNHYRILIAEDDALISESLKHHLEDLGHAVIGIVSNKSDAKSYLDLKPDFCFLDIRMHGKDEGFAIAELIQERYQIPFVFLTSFADANTVGKASQYNPAGYLVKPFKQSDIFSTIEIAIAKDRSSNEEKVEIKDGTKTYFVKASDILYAKADNVYVEIITTSKKFVERTSLDKFLEKLPDNFVRCHRSFVINKNLIEQRSSSEFRIGNDIIPISRTYKENIDL